MTTIVFILALLATVFEGVLAIPVIGGTIVIGTYYGALGVMFLLHAAVLVLRILDKKGESLVAPGFGMVASILAVVPFLGFVLHVVTFILYIVDFAQKKK